MRSRLSSSADPARCFYRAESRVVYYCVNVDGMPRCTSPSYDESVFLLSSHPQCSRLKLTSSSKTARYCTVNARAEKSRAKRMNGASVLGFASFSVGTNPLRAAVKIPRAKSDATLVIIKLTDRKQL